jgi:hypothetical protein
VSGGGPVRSSGARVTSAILALAFLTASVACTWQPSPTTTTSTTTRPGGHPDHGHDGPYTSPDDPRLTPEQRQRAKDLITRTNETMRAFPDQISVMLAGYVSIGDAISGHEHFVNYSYFNDGHFLDPERIEAIVFEAPLGRPTRVVAAMYMLDSPTSPIPEVAGPLTPWHNHKDLCWDSTGFYVVGAFRLGRCIPYGILQERPPMLHVWVVENPCGPFAEVSDTAIIDYYLRAAGLIPTPDPTADPCDLVHGGDHLVPTTTTTITRR